MKQILIKVAGAGLLIGILAFVFQTQIFLAMMPRMAERRLVMDAIADLPDGLHVFVCGAGSPMPNPHAGGPCLAVIAGKSVYVVDAGTGGVRTMALSGIAPGTITAVLLTHFHSDHIDGLGELQLLRWAQGGTKTPLPVYGPPGVEMITDGINLTYKQDFSYRIAHHGEDTVPPSGAGVTPQIFSTPPDGESVTVIDSGDLKVIAFRVDHSPVSPSVGYRFDYKGRSVVISGDTVKSDNLQAFAKDVDVLIHEGLATNLVKVMQQVAEDADRPRMAKIFHDIQDYHASPKEAAEVAQAAGAKMLGFYHIVPPMIVRPMEKLFLEGVAEAYDGPAVISKDGMFYHMPAGSTEIEVD